jgi:aldose 1-epimerase
MTIARSVFGQTNEGKEVDLFVMDNGKLELSVITYGGIITALKTPDKQGKLGDIVLGFEGLEPYLHSNPYFGCITGRFANRIAKGRFQLDGQSYHLAQNNGESHLHGGLRGFDKVIWQAEVQANSLILRYQSPDGEEGYPGSLEAEVVYTLESDSLRIDYTATTDKPTILNLTNHSYFNLAGAGDILNHQLLIDADHFLPTDASQIPTGELRAVAGTALDFRRFTPIGARIGEADEQLQLGKGYDHNWVLNRPSLEQPSVVVRELTSGRRLELFTTQPGVQFYSGNVLPSLTGKGGQLYQKRSGFCLETQHFPDSPNQPQFPSTVLRPGERYAQTTVFRFG